MRIISGSARGRKLATFDSNQIRPTPDRVREALFSLLSSRFGSIHGLKVLELFAGTGAQSLEAISRGAISALLIEKSPYAINIIKQNISRCGFDAATRVIRGDVLNCLPQTLPCAPFDLILLDPPYQSNVITQVIEKIETLNLLTEGGIICAETAHDETLVYQGTIQKLQSRIYGSTGIHLFGALKE